MWNKSDFQSLRGYGRVIFPEDVSVEGINEETIVGYEDSKKILETFFGAIERFIKMKNKNFRLRPNLSALLYGPPGTGKTTLVKAYAAKFNLPIFLVFADSLVSQYLGETMKRMNMIISEIQKLSLMDGKGPIILFFDEIDAIASERSNAQEVGEIKRAVISFLQRIDDLFYSKAPVAVIGATNHADSLDSAVWRRFSFHVEFGFPSVKAKKYLIKTYLDEVQKLLDVKNSFSKDEIITDDFVEEYTQGFTGADIERAFQLLVLKLFRLVDEGITEDLLIEALETTKGTEKHLLNQYRLMNVYNPVRENKEKEYTKNSNQRPLRV